MSEQALLPRSRDRRHWSAPGLNETQERLFHVMAAVLVLLMLAGWGYSFWRLYTDEDSMAAALAAEAGGVLPVAREIRTALTEPTASSLAFLNEAALSVLSPLKGESGELRTAIVLPGETIASGGDGVNFRVTGAGTGNPVAVPELASPERPGVYKVALEFQKASRALEGFSVITLVPFSQKREGRIGTYMVGSWPYESGGTPRSPAYANPPGFIEVTPENRDLQVSEHFRLGDFLTKDQPTVWPKYLLLDPKLLDKLELIVQELEAMGVDVQHVTVMSGFRTPRYNHSGGNTEGRANLSRHMYGDGADVFVDNDRDSWTDDINGDGRVDTRDAEMMARAAERVEAKHPSLKGGIGTYSACCGHGPFIHVDVRGYRARWRGSGNG